MTDDYDMLLADLRVLADTVLDFMDGMVDQLADRGDAAGAGHTAHASGEHGDGDPGGTAESGTPVPTGCSWCPVCAVVALFRGENHELLTRLAAQLATFIALIREWLARHLPGRPGPSAPTDPAPPESRDPSTGFVPISVTIRP